MSDLDRLADTLGITPHYFDVWGHRRVTSDDTKRALLGAMGIAAASDREAAESLRAVEVTAWRRPLPPVLVVDEGAAMSVPVTAPAGLDGARLDWTLGFEDGGRTHAGIVFGDLPPGERRDIDGRPFVRRTLTLPSGLPCGYHDLAVAIGTDSADGGLRGSMRIIVAPPRGLTVEEAAPPGRLWGFGVQLYSLRSAADWGLGGFAELGRFAATAGRLGAGLVGLNPLHALFPADPRHFSPYSPSSRRFLGVLAISIESVPELADCAEARAMIAEPAFLGALAAARGAELVDYPAVARLKMPVLEALHRRFRADAEARPGNPRAAAFAAFCAAMGEGLHHQAVFEALHDRFLAEDPGLWMWHAWPEAFRSPGTDAVRRFAADHAARIQFFEFLQWEADRQLGEAAASGREAGLALGFYRDLAVAVNPGGATTWAEPRTVVHGASVGAPPDAFNMKGQNWGLAPLSPTGLVEAAYEPFIAMVRANMRHAGALRIDHVMAVRQLFWIPENGADGAYVRYPFEDLLRILALESRRNRCVVIGEDLGTVPDGFRPAMNAAGILSYRVLYFERDAEGRFLPPSAYPADAMVTVTTHDLPAFRGFWEGRDQEWRSRLDLYPDAAARDRDAWDRGVDRWRLLQALEREGLRPARYTSDDGGQPWSWDLTVAVHRFLGRTPGRIAMVQIEDALGEAEQPNLPGTTDQHPNWRRRLGRAVEEIDTDSHVASLADALCMERRF